VTHDQEEALSMSDQMAVMNAGRLEQVGSPEDVYLRPRTAFVANFLGAVNWMGGVGVRPEAMRITRTAEDHPARCCPGVVTGLVFLGECIQIQVQLSSGENAIARVHRGVDAFESGDAIFLSWNSADEMTF